MLADASKDELREVVRCLSHVCRSYTNCISELTDIEKIGYRLRDGKRCYGFVPTIGYEELLYELTMLYNAIRSGKFPGESIKFLDIGCGIGNIVLLANAVGFSAYGLEYNRKIYRAAKQLCKYGMYISNGDMRKFRHYKDYDVLYYYQPMNDADEMEKFSRQLAEAMKPGAYVIANGANSGFRRSREFELIQNIGINKVRDMWKKKEK